MSRASRPPELLVGPFTSSQARAAGLTAEQLRSACWRRLFHGVYIAAELADTVALRARAIGLVLPPGAVVGYSTAAWLRGVDVRPSPYFAAVEVIAQRGDQIRRQGVHARSAKLDEADVVAHLRNASDDAGADRVRPCASARPDRGGGWRR